MGDLYNLPPTQDTPLTREEVIALIQGQVQNLGGLVRLGGGTNQIKMDAANGLSVGGTDFASAPFSVDMSGVVTALSLNQRLRVTAGQALSNGQSVFIGADGKAYLLSSLHSDITNRFAGFATETAAANATVSIQKTGLLTSSGLTAGSFYYASDGTAGQDLSAQTGGTPSPFYGVNWEAQTFTTGGSYFLVGVMVYLYKTGSPANNVTVALRATSGGLPTGANLAVSSRTLAESSLTGSSVGYLFPFTTPYQLSASTVYAIVVNDGGSVITDAPIWTQKDVGSYSGGSACTSSNSGSTWSTTGSSDKAMITYYATGTPATSAGTVSKTVGLATTTTQLLLGV